jgi:hypothetical protein
VGLVWGDPTVGSFSSLKPPRKLVMLNLCFQCKSQISNLTVVIKKPVPKNTTLRVVARVVDLAFL